MDRPPFDSAYYVIMIFDDSTSLMDSSMTTLYLALAYLVPHCASSPGSSTRALDSTIIILHRSCFFFCDPLFFNATVFFRVLARKCIPR
jgi:hypothetical protein